MLTLLLPSYRLDSPSHKVATEGMLPERQDHTLNHSIQYFPENNWKAGHPPCTLMQHTHLNNDISLFGATRCHSAALAYSLPLHIRTDNKRGGGGNESNQGPQDLYTYTQLLCFGKHYLLLPGCPDLYNHNQTSTNGTYTRSVQCGSGAFLKRKDHINVKTQPHVQQTYGVECNVNWYSTSLQ